jgi:hypothetical protein
MTDPRTPDELDLRLRDAFRAGDLPAAPASLRDALERVPDASVIAGRGVRRERQRGTQWSLLGVAAVLAIGSVVAVAVGQRGPSIAPAPLASDPPSAALSSPSATAAAVRITYEVAWDDLSPANEEDLAAIETILGRRLEATGVVGSSVGRLDGQLIVDLPIGVDPDPIRRMLGQTGEAAFVPAGAEPVSVREVLEVARLDPLFESDGIAGASVGSDQAGNRALIIQLGPAAAELFGAWTADHVGSYVAITIDGVVIAAPMINSEIPGGSVEILQGGSDGWDAAATAEFAAILDIGPLPVPIRELSNGPAPSAGLPPPTVAPIAVRQCEPPIAVEGEQITCEEAVTAAIARLPAGHPAVRMFAFRHQCFDPDHPDVALDCAVQFFAVVDVFYGEGPADVTIGVRMGSGGVHESFVLPGPQPSGDAPSFTLTRTESDLGCDSIMPPYRSWTFHIDPSAAEPVWAIANTGTRLRVEWGLMFRGIVGPPSLVVDDHGLEVIRDGTSVVMPDAAWPSLAGRFVCPSPDTVYVLDGPAALVTR